MEPIAVCGTSVCLPCDINSADDLFDVVKNKTQCNQDLVGTGRFSRAMVDESDTHNPWKLHHRRANLFKADEDVRRHRPALMLSVPSSYIPLSVIVTVESWDAHFFRVTSKLAKNMDHQQIAVLQLVWQALEDAGICARDIYRTRTGIYVGGYSSYNTAFESPDETVPRGTLMASLSDHVAYFFGTQGPCMTMDTACSSATVALASAVSALRQGDCDYAIVASVNMLSRNVHLSMQACGVLSSTGISHPFDADAKGYVRCEGVGAIILRRVSDAEACNQRILSVVRHAVPGHAGPRDGVTEGVGRPYEAPSACGFRNTMTRAYNSAGIDPASVSYVECHATGTVVGDVIELQAVGDVIGSVRAPTDGFLRVASVKSNIGHGEWAAGLFSLIKVVEMLHRRVYLPSAGVTHPREDFNWGRYRMRVAQEVEAFPPLTESATPVVVGLNSAGIGGALAHVILQEYQRPEASSPPQAAPDEALPPLLFPLSAVSESHLKVYAEKLASFIRAAPEGTLNLIDMCYTMAKHRESLKYRSPVLTTSLFNLAESLDDIAKTHATDSAAANSATRVMFIFTGQGAQWAGCGKTLMQFPLYAQAVRQADAAYQAVAGFSILERTAEGTSEIINDVMYAAPMTFLIQIGLVHLLRDTGINPFMVLGHSAGEVAAAYASGILTLKEAAEIMYWRTQEMLAIAGSGRLLAVGMGRDALLPLLPPNIELACINSPQSVVVAGPEDALLHLKASLKLSYGIRSSLIPGNIAFHSSATEPIIGNVRKRLAFLDGDRQEHQGVAAVFISSVTGQEEKALPADYWCRNIRRPVQFMKAVEWAFSDSETAPDLVIEIGPNRTILGLLKQTITSLGGHDSTYTISTLMKGQECSQVMMSFFNTLLQRGNDVSLGPLYSAMGGQFVASFPKHPFLRKPVHTTKAVFEQDWGLFNAGPLAGDRRDDAYYVEVSDRTFNSMTDHNIGGKKILPGIFFVEMAVEVVGLPCALTNVQFPQACPIPSHSSGEVSRRLRLSMIKSIEERDGGHQEAREFTVTSVPLRVNIEGTSISEPIEHCKGYVVGPSKLQDKDLSNAGYLPSAFELVAKTDIRDIGKEGLEALIRDHSKSVATSKELVYGLINYEGLRDYGPSFQMVKSIYSKPGTASFLGRIDYDGENWQRRGGRFTPQLMDSLIHCAFALPGTETGRVWLNGGFETAYFVRLPATKDIYFHLQRPIENEIFGLTMAIGDVKLYDGLGNLCLTINGMKALAGMALDSYKLTERVWQPLTMPVSPLPSSSSSEALAESLLNAALALRKETSGGLPAVFRFLEVVESDEEGLCLVETLSHLKAPEGVVVEAWVASHNPAIVPNLASKTAQASLESWLRLRKVFMPSLASIAPDIMMQALVLHDWSTICHSWEADAEDSESRSAIAMAMEEFHPFLVPQALVLISHVQSQVDGWCKILEGGSESSPAISLPEEKEEDGRPNVIIADGDDANTIMEKKSEEVVTIVGRYTTHLRDDDLSKKSLLVFSEDIDAAATLASFVTRKPSGLHVEVIPSGAQGGPADDSPQEVWNEALSTGMEKIEQADQKLQSIVFLATASTDDTLLGTRAFDRLAKLTRALFALQSRFATMQEVKLWIVTEGAYVGPMINPAMGCIQGLCLSIMSELDFMSIKFVDHCSGLLKTKALSNVASLLEASPREMIYAIDEDEEKEHEAKIKVMRYVPIDVKATRRLVRTNSQVTFKCQPSSEICTPGEVHVDLVETPEPVPDEGEVVIDVHSVGLNYRDVMVANNRLPEASLKHSYFRRVIGLEGAGVVSAVGSGVDPGQVGARVFAFSGAGFGNRVVTSSKKVRSLPEDMSFEVAASLFVVYATAHRALVDIAQVKAGDKVLIHTAAGGVGLAAISICKYLGATVYATTSEPKRGYLRSAYGVKHVYDSRSYSWFPELMHDTRDEGVDVVLNSLRGRHQTLGIHALAPLGHFLEIGKVDTYQNSKIGLLALSRNVSVSVVDLDLYTHDDKYGSLAMSDKVLALLRSKAYPPLPIEVFPISQFHEAIVKLQCGTVVGKLVLSNYDEEGDAREVSVSVAPAHFHPNATYIVTGAAGGFGSLMLRDLYEKGARHFVVTVTRVPERIAALFPDLLADADVTMDVVVADTGKEEDVSKVIATARSRPLYPLRGIFHAAGTSMDCLLSDVTSEYLEISGAGKARGAWYLHQHTLDLHSLDYFVVISSAKSIIANRGLAPYAATNGFVDTLVRLRRSLDLPATTFNMTGLSDVGILAQNVKVRRANIHTGTGLVPARQALQDLGKTLAMKKPEVQQMWFPPNLRLCPFSACITHGVTSTMTLGLNGSAGQVTPQMVQGILVDTIKRLAGHDEVFLTSHFTSIGLDSFTTTEFISRIQQRTGVELKVSTFTADCTVMDLIRIVQAQLGQKSGSGSTNMDKSFAVRQDRSSDSNATIKPVNLSDRRSPPSTIFEAKVATSTEPKKIKVLPSQMNVASETTAVTEMASRLSSKPGSSQREMFSSSRPILGGRHKTDESKEEDAATELPLSALSQAPKRKERKGCLLFGATGLAGGHLLAEIVSKCPPHSRVYCIVRAKTPGEAHQRIVKNLESLQLWDPTLHLHDRVVAIPGDLTQASFGLPSSRYRDLIDSVGDVMMAAGDRQWASRTQELERCNVQGMKHIVDFALASGAHVHYLSTVWLDLVENGSKLVQDTFTEYMPYIPLKRRGEEILAQAQEQHAVPCHIYRLPLLSVNRHGGFSGGFLLLTIMQRMFATGQSQGDSMCFPVMTSDRAAKCVVKRMKAVKSKVLSNPTMYHFLDKIEWVAMRDLAAIVEELRGAPLERIVSSEEGRGHKGSQAALLWIFGSLVRDQDTVRMATVGKDLEEAMMALMTGRGGARSVGSTRLNLRKALWWFKQKFKSRREGKSLSCLFYVHDYVSRHPESIMENSY